jgi:hypothetical protein
MRWRAAMKSERYKYLSASYLGSQFFFGDKICTAPRMAAFCLLSQTPESQWHGFLGLTH